MTGPLIFHDFDLLFFTRSSLIPHKIPDNPITCVNNFQTFSMFNHSFSLFQDLVKSHLMFAVREEVEVLKERIAELMERINQLEVENTYLRAHASQDTLAQLPAAGAKPPPAQQGPQPPVS